VLTLLTRPEQSVANYIQRRRAQNRASQRAFRERKEKNLKKLEQQLDELEGQYKDLNISYESLQLENLRVKEEVSDLRKVNRSLEASSVTLPSYDLEGDGSNIDILEPFFFDTPSFFSSREERDDRKENVWHV